jgi:hypothetical protein
MEIIVSVKLSIEQTKLTTPVLGLIPDHIDNQDKSFPCDLPKQNIENKSSLDRRSIKPTSIVRISKVVKKDEIITVQGMLVKIQKINVHKSELSLLEKKEGSISLEHAPDVPRRRFSSERKIAEVLSEQKRALIALEKQNAQNLLKEDHNPEIQTVTRSKEDAGCCCIC